MTLEELRAVAEIVEKLTNRYRDQEAAHKAALTEIRASFNARTSADEKIIEGLRAEIIRVNEAHGRTKVENDGLLDELAAQRDAFTAEVAALKSQTPKQHPVKVGEWVECTLTDACDQRHPLYRIGTKGRVGSIVERPNHIWEYHVTLGGSNQVWWESSYCIPCDPPAADHDTEAGKAVAESALKTEPVERGDLVKVFQATGSMTDAEDIGCGGVVYKVDVDWVWLDRHYTMDLPRQGVASLSDVRKVTT